MGKNGGGNRNGQRAVGCSLVMVARGLVDGLGGRVEVGCKMLDHLSYASFISPCGF